LLIIKSRGTTAVPHWYPGGAHCLALSGREPEGLLGLGLSSSARCLSTGAGDLGL